MASGGGWESPTDFTLRDNADRFLAANPSYISIYLLNNALEYLLTLGEEAIQAHSLALGNVIHEGLATLGLEMMTPKESHRRAGNTCFMIENVNELRSALDENGVLVWGAYGRFGRVRVSAHVHNDSDDVSRLLESVEKYLHTSCAR